ncbi:MAG: RNA-directed DNA polymerase, partial [Sodaliphilus sp.]|nr:RNA-directed DNA polymerase [Sodaliphilus sp.]
EKQKRNSIPVILLNNKDALEYFLGMDQYCTTELPEYFTFEPILDYAKRVIGDKTLDQCLATNTDPMTCVGVNLDVITNKDGRYAVRPLTLANPFLYYMLARDICSETAWKKITECFNLYSNKHITACAIPRVKVDDKPEPFKNAKSILNWWSSIEQRSIELSLKYRYMFMTDITNCFGQINPESISWALARKGTPYETNKNEELASNIRHYLRAMQEGRNIGIPQGSALFSLIAEIILGYADMLLAKEICECQKNGSLPEDLEYDVLRYVDDYRIFCNDSEALDKISYMLQHILERFNFRMNSSKTRTSYELITDSIKPDKAFYIFNTPIVSKQTYLEEDGKERKVPGYDFDGFQKHLLFIYEFSRRYPNSGQLVSQLEAFSKRVEDQLSTKTKSRGVQTIDLEFGKVSEETETKEYKGHLWENISAMVAIAVEIAANNLRAANNALKIASQLLADMHEADQQKKKEIIELIYKKLKRIPNSAFLQVWLQNITHTTDNWSKGEVYDMPLCKVVAEQPVSLWNNQWLIPEIASTFPQNSIVDRDALAKTGQIITFKAKRLYDGIDY